MKSSLINYLNSRLQNEKIKDNRVEKESGPVITISREVGCNATKLAFLLQNRLNLNKSTDLWKVVSKEVFYESAKKLKINQDEVRKVFKQTEKYTFDDILKAFSSKPYVSDRKIVNTVIGIIFSFASEGNFILVGRASNIITKDIKKSLHIRLFAPLEYRLKNIMENNRLSISQAKAFIQQVENERIAFRNAMNENHLNIHMFDLYFNRATLSDDTIVEMIEYAAKKKNLI